MEHEDRLFTDEMKEPVNVLRWLLLLLTWDGILPIGMAMTPSVIQWIWPGNLPARDLVVTLFLIVGLFVRVTVGLSHISTNYCSLSLRTCQRATLFVMACFLILMDALLMTIPISGNMQTGDIVFLTIAAAIYLSGMAFVLFPGQKPIQNSAVWH